MNKHTKAGSHTLRDKAAGTRVQAEVAKPQRKQVVIKATNRAKSARAVDVAKGLHS